MIGSRGRSRRILIATLMLLATTVSACTATRGEHEPQPTREPTGAPPDRVEPMELDVLVYNVEYGGDETTDAVIREIDADIVGVLESYNRLPAIARATGYPYYNVGLQILSKYPIHEPSGADGLYSLIEVQPGYVVAFFNTHLDYVKYGPRLYLREMPLEEVIASELEVRTASMQILIPDMERLASEGVPVFLTGDFNTPSHEDYTQATVGTREGIDVPIEWPTTKAIVDAGLYDTYREIHPDPVAVPGITKDNPDFQKGGSGDRIDYLFAGGPVTTLSSQLVGEPGGPDVDLTFEPWTSDHRAVLSTVETTPVPLPTTVSLTRRLLTEGQRLNAYTNAPGHEEVEIAVMPEGASATESVVTVTAPGRSEITVDTADLAPGGYDVVMSAGGDEIARNAFWVRSIEDDIVLTTDRETYAPGEPITVMWDDGPANRWDWI
ncbi:MAG TPA: endonuclease/exonuclease/phosphatase family protein, partial [Candidatus Limnocylindrales bacterium]|nr:endonuclease/exonuclease/phosphatase family protein [Candidatus Limnocylindrales bacterium]